MKSDRKPRSANPYAHSTVPTVDRARRRDLGLGGTAPYRPVVIDPDGKRHRIGKGSRRDRAVKVTSADGSVRWASPTDARKPLTAEVKRSAPARSEQVRVIESKYSLFGPVVVTPAKRLAMAKDAAEKGEYGVDWS